ncbi:MAG: nucleoside hydrolase [Candidatus Marinimicrobia bacterium]|nr:nucleoside hydrolase [Candidatus Neomarinimicrobiota bacterium]
MNAKTKVLLSTDIGSDIDDALCLITMINHPDIDLRAIYTVNGDVISRAYIAKKMINLAQKEVVVACGEERPIGPFVKPYSSGESYYVDNDFLKDDSTIIKNGVEHMAHELTKEKYVILSIAPLTNIARLLREFPDSAKNIEHLYIMGCRFPTNRLEHNLRFDTIAAQEVFNSNIPLTVVPGNICDKYRMPTKLADQMRDSTVGNYVSRMLDSFIGAAFFIKYYNTDVDGIPLNKILDDDAVSAPGVLQKIGEKRYIEAIDLNRACVNNIIYTKAYEDPVMFWDNINTLLSLMKSDSYPYLQGKRLADILEGSVASLRPFS